MTKYPDYIQRLAEYLANVKQTPFAWGEHDCCQFAGNAVLAMTGTDPMAQYRERYTTEVGAEQVLSNEGFDSLKDAITDALGITPTTNTKRAVRGDIALIQLDDEQVCGVVFGKGVFTTGTNGLTFKPRSTLVCIWKL